MVGAQDYALFRLCFCEGHRTLLPPSCHLVQKRECNVDAPLGPEQDLKLLFPCNPKDPGSPQRGYPQPAHGELRGEGGRGGGRGGGGTAKCKGRPIAHKTVKNTHSPTLL